MAVCLLMGTPVATAKKPEVWLEVTSPHFRVVSNGNEKEARKVADQFERIRSAFKKALPDLRVDPNAPIIVLAAKDEKSFANLEPSSWQQKGQLQRTGLFLRGPEKNYVLLRMNAEGENPYQVVYHEYTHLLVNEGVQVLPLWLDEGLAEFYGNTEIESKDVLLGRPSADHILLLRENKLLPLSTLFAVDHSSPYYNEEHKGSIFYAESWALTHYLLLSAPQEGKNPLLDFFKLLGQNVGAESAATQSFGDLNQLQDNLDKYIHESSYKYVVLKGSTEVDEANFKVRELSPSESEAVRGDFLAYNDRYTDARTFLQDALQEDPKNAQAAESLGFLEFRQDHPAEAKKWFTQAVNLNSQSYLAHYYFAVMSMQESAAGPDSAQIESSLRAAIKINPNFAPAYDALESFYAIHGQRLDEARMLGLRAISLEPGNVRYRLNVANVFLRMEQPENAAKVAKLALSMAKTIEESSAAHMVLDSAQKYQEYLDSVKKQEAEIAAAQQQSNLPTNSDQEGTPANPNAGNGKEGDATPPLLRHRDVDVAQTGGTVDSGNHPPPARGQRTARDGTITSVKCSPPTLMDLSLETPSGTLQLHSMNYFSVIYSALNYTPTQELHPCRQIQGMKARISFYEIKGQPYSGEMIAVQLRK